MEKRTIPSKTKLWIYFSRILEGIAAFTVFSLFMVGGEYMSYWDIIQYYGQKETKVSGQVLSCEFDDLKSKFYISYKYVDPWGQVQRSGDYSKKPLAENTIVELVYFERSPSDAQIDSDEYQKYRRNMKREISDRPFTLGFILLMVLIVGSAIVKHDRRRLYYLQYGIKVTGHREGVSNNSYLVNYDGETYSCKLVKHNAGFFKSSEIETLLMHPSKRDRAYPVGALGKRFTKLIDEFDFK
jgi:hypothetical protein